MAGSTITDPPISRHAVALGCAIWLVLLLAAAFVPMHVLAAAALRERLRAPAAAAVADLQVFDGRRMLAVGGDGRVMVGPASGRPATVTPAGASPRALHLLGDGGVAMEEERGALELVAPGIRTMRIDPLRSVVRHWSRTVWLPLVDVADRTILDFALQIDPWLGPGEAAPRRLGMRRDCDGCPAMAEMSGGATVAGPLLWQRRGEDRRRIVAVRTVAFSHDIGSREWAGCVADRRCALVRDRDGSHRLAFTSEEVVAYLAWLRSRTGRAYRLPTSDERDALGGDGIGTSGEWVCRDSADSPCTPAAWFPVGMSATQARRTRFAVVAP